MRKHTPGPWQALPDEVDKPYIRVRGTALGYRYKVSNVLKPGHDGMDKLEADETRANANLIAAAPDLFKALRCLLHSPEFSTLTLQQRVAIVEAIELANDQANRPLPATEVK